MQSEENSFLMKYESEMINVVEFRHLFLAKMRAALVPPCFSSQ